MLIIYLSGFSAYYTLFYLPSINGIVENVFGNITSDILPEAFIG
jgi:hypothetical protein